MIHDLPIKHSYTNQHPLVSVLMPVRALAKGPDKHLIAALNSILGQTLRDIELLLIGYKDILAWHEKLPPDPRIKILVREQSGIVPALNCGLQHAGGHYLARMDADDVAMPHRLERQLNYLQAHPSLALIGSQVRICNQQGLGAGNERYEQWLNSVNTTDEISRNLFIESPLPHPTWFTTKAALTALSGWRDTDWAEDYDLLLRAQIAGLGLGKVPEPLLDWHDHDNRLTRIDQRYSRRSFIRAKAWAIARIFAPKTAIICGTGRNARWLHDALEQEGVRVRWFVELDEQTHKTSKRHKPIINYQQLLHMRTDELVVTAVTAWGARDALRKLLSDQQLTENKDFVIAG